MTRDRLTHIDRYLLVTLRTLLAEKSISKTAQILDQSPPAISLALRKLRELLRDPLLVRNGSTMVLTERGEHLLQPVIEALDSIDRIFLKEGSFDPSTAALTLHIASSNSLAAFFLPPLIEQVRREAPLINLVVRTIDPEFDYQKALGDGALDLVIGDWPQPPESLRISPLLENEICCMMRLDHPQADPAGIGLETYLQLNHLSPTSTSATYLGPIGGKLAQLGLKRRIVMAVPEFNLIPFLLLHSDLVFTTARCFCDFWATVVPLAVVPAPDIFEPMRFYLLWHDRAHTSPHGQWLRSLLQAVARDLVLSGPQAGRLTARGYAIR
jgi:DNA-binding transcriptional LysR family regulator